MPSVLALLVASLSLAVPQEEDVLARALAELGRGVKAEGLALVVEVGGEPLFEQSLGSARTDARFRVGPLLGSFLSVAALRLAQREALDLDAPLSARLPELYPEQPEVTAWRLMTHTAGLPGYDALFEGHEGAAADRERILAWLADAPLASTPGTCVAPSPTDDFLLGLLLESVSGASVPELLAREVFEPAGMEDTGWIDAPLPRHEAEVVIESCGVRTSIGHAPAPFEAEGLVSTAADLARFWNALTSGGLLDDDARTRWATHARLTDGHPVATGAGVGLGMLDDFECLTMGGTMTGTSVHLAAIPATDTTIVVVARGDVDVVRLVDAVARTVLGTAAPEVRDLELSDAERASYVGDYYAGCTSYPIVAENGHLVLVHPLRGRRLRLLHQGDGTFVAADDPEVKLVFEHDDGRVVAFVLTEHGVRLRAVRAG